MMADAAASCTKVQEEADRAHEAAAGKGWYAKQSTESNSGGEFIYRT